VDFFLNPRLISRKHCHLTNRNFLIFGHKGPLPAIAAQNINNIFLYPKIDQDMSALKLIVSKTLLEKPFLSK
jgi:hypothetical protein